MTAHTKQTTPAVASRRSALDRWIIGLLLAIFGGVVLHAPLSVWLGTVAPEHSLLIKAWKELLLVGAAVLIGIALTLRRRLDILKKPLVVIAAAYVALHIILLPVFWQGTVPALAGLLIDLRFVVAFVAVYIAALLYPELRRPMVAVAIAGALVVGVFAALQVTILPSDFLSVLGYGPTTIAPYILVDLNPDYVRISSTLRGPNPLGAYAVIVLAGVGAWWALQRAKPTRHIYISASLLVLLSVALWFSYSRSALVGAALALAVVFLFTVARRLPRWVWVGLFVVLGVMGGLLFAARDSHFVANVLLHQNPAGGSSVSSNDEHIESLGVGLERLVTQPLGAGIGSTGSASLHGDAPIVIENQYLFVAHETGWLGLLGFLALFGAAMKGLYARRRDWLALGVFASGIGLAAIGLLLPVWVDDTVAIVWWMLAGVALAHRVRI